MNSDHGSTGDLRTARGSKGVSLQEISKATKIRVHYLEAIETGEFKKLPGGVYAISYIRQYARAIDFNESELLQRYHLSVKADPAAANGTPSSADDNPFVQMIRQADRVAS